MEDKTESGCVLGDMDWTMQYLQVAAVTRTWGGVT